MKMSTACVVGNGPLSDQDRNDIQNFSGKVARFNDTKNKRNGDRHDIHVQRTHAHNNGFNVCDHDTNECKKYELKGGSKANGQYHGYTLFEGCPFRDDFDMKRIEGHPTTGAMFLSNLQNSMDVQQIHIYGMNWQMSETHHSRLEKELIDKCCTKCIVHETPTNNYLPDKPASWQETEMAL